MTWQMIPRRALGVLTATVLAASIVGPTVATAAPADTSRPTAPQMISGSQVFRDSISFSFTESTDNVGVAGYTYFRNGVEIAPDDVLDSYGTWADVRVPGGNAWIQVQAFDAAGNVSAKSSPLRIEVDSRPAIAPRLLGAVFNSETECVDVTYHTEDWRGTRSTVLISNRYPLNGGRVPDFAGPGSEPFEPRAPKPIQTASTCLLETGTHYLQLLSERVSGESAKTWPLLVDVPEISPPPRVGAPESVTAQVLEYADGNRNIVVRWDDPGPDVEEINIVTSYPQINGVSGSNINGNSARSERVSIGLPAGIEAPYTLKFAWIDRFGDPSDFSAEIVLDPNERAPLPATDLDATYNVATGCVDVSFDVSADDQNISTYRVIWGSAVAATLPGSSASLVEARREVVLCELESGRRGLGLEASFDDGPASRSSGSLTVEVPPR